jgi:hypothetical protein
VTGGYGSPRYGCHRAWKQGRSTCQNRLTVRTKVADPALLAGLRDALLEPRTVAYLMETVTQRLNALLDERPRRRAARLAEREGVARKVAHLVRAIESGSGSARLLATLGDREAELRELDLDLIELDEPLEQQLAVIPGWVRQQVSDVAGLLSESPERAKREFRRLGVAFTVSPVVDQSPRPFLRAVGTTDFSAILAGSSTDFSTTVRLNPVSNQKRTHGSLGSGPKRKGRCAQVALALNTVVGVVGLGWVRGQAGCGRRRTGSRRARRRCADQALGSEGPTTPLESSAAWHSRAPRRRRWPSATHDHRYHERGCRDTPRSAILHGAREISASTTTRAMLALPRGSRVWLLNL